MNPIYHALAGTGVALNAVGAALNGFAAAALSSPELAVLALINLGFFVGLILLWPWGK